MAATFYASSDPIPVNQLCCVLYGIPGGRKTSLAQTAERPFTFAFDKGIYRAFGRKDSAKFDTWVDVIETWNAASNGTEGPLFAAIRDARTIIVDTIGAGMKSLAEAIIAESPKNGNRLGGLALAGYGILATRFSSWVESVKQTGKDLVLIAHEDGDKVGDVTYYSPQVVGQKFYNDLMQVGDIIGRLYFANGKRVIGWEPTDFYMAKTPPAAWGVMPMPEFSDRPAFLADLLADAKAKMGQVSAASAATAQTLEIICTWLQTEPLPTLENVNDYLKGDYLKLPPGIKAQVWKAISAYAKGNDWKADRKAGVFTAKEIKEEVPA